MKIVPSILSANWGKMLEEIQALKEVGCDLIHLDVMDGHFVPNLTLGPKIIKDLYKASGVEFDVHLMVRNTESFVDLYSLEGVRTIMVHVEDSLHLHRQLDVIQKRGFLSGVVYNPSTPLNGIEYLWEVLDQVLLMTVNPGFGGQEYIPSQTNKISLLKSMAEEAGKPNLLIEVDGGVNKNTLKIVKDAGANLFVMGSAIFDQKEPAKTYKEYEDIIK